MTNRYQEYFRGHALWQRVSRLGDLADEIEALPQGHAEADPAAEREFVERLRWVVTVAQTVLNEADANGYTFSRTRVNSLDNQASGVVTQLQQFLQWIQAPNYPGQVQASLTSADSHVDAMIDDLVRWPGFGDGATVAVLEQLQRFRDASAGQLDKLTGEIEQLRTTYGQDAATRASQVEQFFGDVQQRETERDEAAAARLAELQHRATDLQAQLDQFIGTGRDELQQQASTFAKAQERRSVDYQDEVETLRDAGTAERETTQQLLRDQIQKVTAQTDDLTTMSREKLAQVESLLQAVGKRAITNDFGQQSKREGRAALVWNCATVAGFLGAAIWLIIYVIIDAGVSSPSWEAVVFKFGVSIALLLLGAYASGRAADHRREQVETKRIQLILSAIDPFLESMTGHGKAMELRTAIAERAFLGAAEPPARSRWRPTRKDVDWSLGVVERSIDVVDRLRSPQHSSTTSQEEQAN